MVQNFSGENKDTRRKRIPSVLQQQTEKQQRGNYLSEIWNLCFHTNGGFGFSEVYDMPIYMRRFFIKKTSKYNEEKNEAEKKAMEKSKSKTPNFKVPKR